MGEQLSFLFQALIGGILAFFVDMFTTWYGVVTVAVSVTIGFLAYGLLGAMLSQGSSRPTGSTIPMSIAGGVTAVFAFILRIWLPDRGAIRFLYDADFSGLYVPLFACLMIFVSGLPAGFVVARYEYASGIGGAWLFRVLGGLVGLVLGVLYHLQVGSGWYTAQQPAGLILAISEFLAPTAGAFLVSKHCGWLVKQYRKGYNRGTDM